MLTIYVAGIIKNQHLLLLDKKINEKQLLQLNKRKHRGAAISVSKCS